MRPPVHSPLSLSLSLFPLLVSLSLLDESTSDQGKTFLCASQVWIIPTGQKKSLMSIQLLAPDKPWTIRLLKPTVCIKHYQPRSIPLLRLIPGWPRYLPLVLS